MLRRWRAARRFVALLLLFGGCARLVGSQQPPDTSDTSTVDFGALPSPDSMVVPDGGCPSGYTQCGAICARLTDDVKHCGACDAPCPPTADRCVNGQCRCGPAAPCSGSLNCRDGACRCIAGGLCQGCCDGPDACVDLSGQSTASCGAGGEPCETCTPGDSCATAGCQSGKCVLSPEPDGTQCDDNDKCTSDETCQSGKCKGTPLDCSHLNGACVKGACASATGTCEETNRTIGFPCDDGQYCTAYDYCSGGACIPGKPRVCSDACNQGTCNEETDACDTTPLPLGTACATAGKCTSGGTCSSGVCVITALPVGTSCGSMGEKCCGTKCCGSITPVCCASANMCCSTGGSCCGTKCCMSGQTCCPSANICCSLGSTCCGTKCCFSGQKCCPGNTCCPSTTTCCGTKCCYTGQTCCPDLTCRTTCPG